jgi:hypothetical protein
VWGPSCPHVDDFVCFAGASSLLIAEGAIILSCVPLLASD